MEGAILLETVVTHSAPGPVGHFHKLNAETQSYAHQKRIRPASQVVDSRDWPELETQYFAVEACVPRRRWLRRVERPTQTVRASNGDSATWS
jgi:hypothetical protein